MRSGTLRTMAADASLFAEGDPAPALYIVVSGKIKLFKWDRRDRELTLGIARSSDIVGTPATFDGGNCPYNAVAIGEGARLFVVARRPFQLLIDSEPTIAAGIVRFLAIQNRQLIEMLKAQALHTVRARFAGYLLAAAGSSDTFLLPEPNPGIAAHLGTVREVVSRTLHQFADLGYISLRGRQVTIRERFQLMQLVENAPSLGSLSRVR